MFEVEQKFHIEDLEKLENRLAVFFADGIAVEQDVQVHRDTYYNHPCRDFASTHEALRVRRCNDVPMVTYKGTKLPGKIKARRELEWRLDPGDHDGSQTEELFVLLGFRRVAEVVKTRRSFLFERDLSGFTVTIDDVQSVGLFAEIELVVDDLNEIEPARDRIGQFAQRLGLHRDEPRSYLRMLLNGEKQQD